MKTKCTCRYFMTVCGSATVFVFAAACGRLEKGVTNRRVAATSDAKEMSEEVPSCEGNRPPVITDVLLNEEVFCEEGIAHIIVKAEDMDSDGLEYRVDIDGAAAEIDAESRRAFYADALDLHRAHIVRVSAGNGCEISRSRFELDGETRCAGTAEQSDDDAYVHLVSTSVKSDRPEMKTTFRL